MSDLDPAVAAALRKINNGIDQLIDSRLRLERTPIDFYDAPRPVTDGVMFSIAENPCASDELKLYAERVARGECQWADIESSSQPVPREVAELKADRAFIWYPSKPHQVEERPYRIPWQ